MNNDKMKAKLAPMDMTDEYGNEWAPQNGRNYGGEKEMVSAWSLVVSTADGLREVVTVRAYMGRSRSASTVYASVWINGKGYSASGTGSATGYGYCKTSQAVADAFASAGVTFWGATYRSEKADYSKQVHFGGTGTDNIERAMVAVARALGFSGRYVIVRH